MNRFETGAVIAAVLAIIAGVIFVVRLDGRVGNLEEDVESIKKTLNTLDERIERRLQVFAGASRAHGSRFTFSNVPKQGQSPKGWGTWSEPLYCPAGQYVCGLQQSVEPHQGPGTRDDDTAMNAVAFYCCPLDPNPQP